MIKEQINKEMLLYVEQLGNISSTERGYGIISFLTGVMVTGKITKNDNLVLAALELVHDYIPPVSQPTYIALINAVKRKILEKGSYDSTEFTHVIDDDVCDMTFVYFNKLRVQNLGNDSTDDIFEHRECCIHIPREEFVRMSKQLAQVADTIESEIKDETN